MPWPCVRISWRVRWFFFCSGAQIGSSYMKEKREWLLGVLLLDQRKVPRYVFFVYPGVNLTSPMPWDSNWLFNSCSASASYLQFMKCLQESTSSSGTVLLSIAEKKRIILRVNAWKFFILFFLGPSCSIICSSCLESSLFCSSYLSAWWEIVVLRSRGLPGCKLLEGGHDSGFCCPGYSWDWDACLVKLDVETV